ncbi:MAG: hypothetical protein HW421_3459 [Ignavibacteria bacterium]|nr:hypothetical protein [Ignavibacteria bacterium]
MANGKKVIVVEDELTNAILLKRILLREGYVVVVAHNGIDALKHLEREKFDAILTDWMMPQVDGIELIRQVRGMVQPAPYIIMITALVSDGARTYALESGADDYIAKPIEVDELLVRLKDGLDRYSQSLPDKFGTIKEAKAEIIPRYVGVFIATSTGGPPTLVEIFKDIPDTTRASFFIVQHGPAWMLETFSQRLKKESNFDVILVTTKMPTKQGCIYIASGDKHMIIEKDTLNVLPDDGPKENFVKPAADPLFRSGAEAFGKYSVGVVLTGLGRDGAMGAAQIAASKGTVIVQDPTTAIAPAMPNTVIQSGITHKLYPLKELSKAIQETIFPLSAQLKMKNM